ncbi:MAG: hypothetical protein WD206_05165 [Actinomycetota bacterium]
MGPARRKAVAVNAIAILLVVVLVAVPGFGISLAFAGPSALPLLSRIALALPLGFCLVGMVSLLLAIVGMHRPALLAPILLALAVGAWAFGLRRHGLKAFSSAWRAELTRLRWTYLVLGVLVVGFAIVRSTYGPEGQVAPTALRYWADGLEIADAHGIPEQTLHWNALVPPTVSKVVLNSFHATVSLVLGRDPLRALSTMLAVVSVGLFVALFAVARKLGLRRTAGLVAVFLLGNLLIGGSDLTADLNHYHAENWGRLVVLGGVLLAVRAMRSEVRAWHLSESAAAARPLREERSGEHRTAARNAAVAGVMFGVAAGTHLVAFAVGALFLVCYGIAVAMADPGFRRRPLRIGATLFACAVVIGVLVLFLPRGDIGFQGAAGREVYASALEQIELPSRFDPTLYLATGELEQPEHEPVLGFYDPPGDEYGLLVSAMLGLPNVPAHGAALMIGPGLLLAAAVLMVFGTRILRALAVASLLLAAGLLTTGLLFLWRYDLYALAHFGKRRLFDYAAIPMVLMFAGTFELGFARLQERWASRPRFVPAMAAAVTVVVAAVVLPSAVEADRPGDATSIEGLSWIRENTSCDGRILADRRTLATFETMTGRAAVLEGMGPHVRPGLLAIAVQEMLQARQFLLYPRLHEEYLRSRGIETVVVTQNANRLGGWYKVAPEVRPPRFPIDAQTTSGSGISPAFEGLLQTPFLELVHSTPSLAVFRVEDFDPSTVPGPDAGSLPGFACEEGTQALADRPGKQPLDRDTLSA